ncbi:MAG: N-acetyl-alpha-D-glucosaminyl L-malate synthase BshA [Bacillota bacterium]
MRIAMLCFPTPGGSGVVAVELAREMARRGHEIHLVSYEMPFRLSSGEKIFYHEVPLREFPLFPYPLFTLETAARLAAVLQEFSPQLIHAHYTLPYSIAAMLARQISGQDRVKIITTVHGTDISTWGCDPAMQPLIRYSLEKSDAVTAVSHSLQREAVALLGLGEEKISVIYNFIDTERYRRNVDTGLQRELAPRGERIIMHISNFRPVKRVPDLIRAFALLVKEKKDVNLVLVGEGVEKQKVMEMVKQMGVSARVRFLGTHVNPAPLLSCADLLVLPSAKESFGLVALEAMACAVPVIAANTGGLPEVVADGQTGLLFPVNDCNALAAAMRRLLDDHDLHRRFAAASRQRAEQFAAGRIIPLYEELYGRLIDSNFPPC